MHCGFLVSKATPQALTKEEMHLHLYTTSLIKLQINLNSLTTQIVSAWKHMKQSLETESAEQITMKRVENKDDICFIKNVYSLCDSYTLNDFKYQGFVFLRLNFL